MPTHKSEDYKLSAVEYYLTEDKTQEESLALWGIKLRGIYSRGISCIRIGWQIIYN